MLKEKFRKYLSIERQYSLHTSAAYIADLDQLSAYLRQNHGIELFEGKSASFVTHQMLRGWMAGLLKEGNAHRTVGRKISTTKTYFSFLHAFMFSKIPVAIEIASF